LRGDGKTDTGLVPGDRRSKERKPKEKKVGKDSKKGEKRFFSLRTPVEVNEEKGGNTENLKTLVGKGNCVGGKRKEFRGKKKKKKNPQAK